MNTMMQRKLQRNIDYHQALADYHGEAAAAAAAIPEGSQPMTASATMPPDHQKLADLHAGVVEQLAPVLAAGMVQPVILNTGISRNASPDVRPAAGRFH